MFPSQRILLFVLIFLSNKKCPVYCQIAEYSISSPIPVQNCPSSQPLAPQLVKSMLTVASANGILSDVLPSIQQIFPGVQQIIQSGGIPLPVVVESPIPPATPAYTQVTPLNTVTPSTGVVTSGSIPVTYLPETPYFLPSGDPIIAEQLQLSSPITVPISAPIESSYLPEEYIPQAYIIPPVTPTYQPAPLEPFICPLNMLEVNPAPVTVQIPIMPPISPFLAIATPTPVALPAQNIPQDIYMPPVIQEVYTNTPVPVLSPIPIAVPSPPIVPNLYGPGSYDQQWPLNLHINMQSPCSPEPVIAVISQAPPPLERNSYPQYNPPSASMYPNPIVVMKKSRSYLKTLLPILLISLIDVGGCNCGGSCNSGSNIPVPYPIPIPTNNPIIIGRCKGKNKGAPKKSKDNDMESTEEELS